MFTRSHQKLSIAGTAQSSLPSLVRDQRRLEGFLEDDVFFSSSPQKATSQTNHHAYCFLHGKCSSELHSLSPPIQSFNNKSHLATSTVMNHSRILRTPLVRKAFHSEIFFSRRATLSNASRNTTNINYSHSQLVV